MSGNAIALTPIILIGASALLFALVMSRTKDPRKDT